MHSVYSHCDGGCKCFANPRFNFKVGTEGIQFYKRIQVDAL